MVQLTQWLLREEYWLPPGIIWDDLQEMEDVRYPQPYHLLFCLPIALLLVALRFLFERKIAIPLSKKLGLQEKEEVRGLAKQCNLQPRQVERWFRYQLNQNRPSVTKKVCEASWRTVQFLIFFFMALAILYDKPRFWNVRECLDGYPLQPPQPSLLGYYLLQFSFYCSFIMTIPFDVRQKDFNLIIVHHVVTILLIGFSYCVNFIHIGSLVMFLHDIPDGPLYGAKMFNYLKWRKTWNTLFAIFSVVFIFARGIVFPYKVLYNTYYYLAELYPPNFGYYFFNTLLVFLYLLDVFWTCLIILMIYRFLIHGKVEKDVRSHSEGSEEEDVDEVDQKAEQKTKTKTPPLSRNCTAGVQKRS